MQKLIQLPAPARGEGRTGHQHAEAICIAGRDLFREVDIHCRGLEAEADTDEGAGEEEGPVVGDEGAQQREQNRGVQGEDQDTPPPKTGNFERFYRIKWEF